MNTYINLPIVVKEMSDQDIVTITIDIDTIEQWYRCLESLDKEIIKSITILDNRGAFKLRLSIDPNIRSTGRGKITRKFQSIDIVITITELEMWLHFFSKYYFEGIGDVDHIDVDIESNIDTSSKGLFLILKIPSASPSISAEEVKKKLGLI